MILHLANDFTGSKVYTNLISELDKNGVSQIMYTPIRSIDLIGKNKADLEVNESSIIYSPILNKYIDRILFKQKIKKILKDIESKIDFKSIKCIHAHTWYSDGAVAYELKKIYNTPYIIAIRSTDINLFWKIPYLKSYGVEILRNATRIIFISKVYSSETLRFERLKSIIEYKYSVIPNGIDEYWIKNSEYIKKNITDRPKLLYVGTFLRRKNIMKLIYAVEKLEREGILCDLDLVGGGGSAETKVLEYIRDKKNIKYLGKISNKNKLKGIYRSADIFTMVSYLETFGLVYIEALSQGIPIVYTKSDGIDGMYTENIGERVESKDVKGIAEGIKKIILNYNQYDFDNTEILKNHDWAKIAKKYINLYNIIYK